jgi:hypothetical protein
VAADLSSFMADAHRTAIVAVTRAEEMPVQETLELCAALETRFGRGPELLIVNGLLPAFPLSASIAAGAAAQHLRLWELGRALNDRELHRLDAGWQGPRVELPLVAVDRGPALIPALRGALEQTGG